MTSRVDSSEGLREFPLKWEGQAWAQASETCRKISMAIAKLDVEFEPRNPVTALMADRKKGTINEEVLNEKVLSAIVEFKVEDGRLKEVLDVLKTLATEVDTVFSVGLIRPVEKDGSIPFSSVAKETGFSVRPNAKINVGLGRPLKEV